MNSTKPVSIMTIRIRKHTNCLCMHAYFKKITMVYIFNNYYVALKSLMN